MINFLTYKSIKNRKFTSFLCVLSIALSVTLFLGIERIRNGARDGFTNTISKTDLIVGAKGGSLQLLLYTVFHIGGAVNNIKMTTYNDIKSNPQVEWTIPISLGDAYRGFRVVATDENFYKHYRFRGDQEVKMQEGVLPADTFDVVLGSEVAKKFKHKVGDPIVISHGLSSEAVLSHDNTPFKIVGIMAPTQTPIDTGVYITLQGMEAIHFGWETGVPSGEAINPDRFKKENIEITQLTSFMVKLKSRIAVLRMRRNIDMYPNEPVMAIIPALSLQEMWETIGYVEQILFLVSLCVLLVGVMSILISLYTSINERRREMAILRSLGASSRHVFFLLLYESSFLVLMGCIFGVASMYGLLYFVRPWLESNFSVYLPIEPLSKTEWYYLAGIFVVGTLAGLIPAIKAYLNSLQDGLTIKI
ncbi:peptide ABC transporter permease [Bacteriovorax stolpii]|uniref:Peptide ABC transporter permease n=1 Tax=Bacteriovorax stolpii TaxID=960 RepID=A0A2K9NT54_BACTC|nr:FtsX-like permease family protein [Bacteriovorax stolpii]AUN98700.1 peptide ABC transporter permease [Bacteriovorax stolpii]TDP55791.1 putative ABC transport system permease protein [Bacteriovorax stolpii]